MFFSFNGGVEKNKMRVGRGEKKIKTVDKN